MAIERDPNIVFDPDGTLRATTSWISKHDEGLAELLKNVRYAYLPNRANVEHGHYVAAILLVNGDDSSPARIGILDVGGATLADLNRWSVWQDQGASLVDGVTQGNGGKAYLFRMFNGATRLIGVKEGKRNCKGFEGAQGSKERGTPGFMRTSVCSDCKAVVDVLVGGVRVIAGKPRKMMGDLAVGRCPDCNGKNIAPWPRSHKCPKCNSHMKKSGAVIMWD